MVNFHKQIYSTLSGILPTHYEMVLHRGLEVPCLSYMELTNVDNATGDTIGYSDIYYQVKVWATDIGTIQEYALLVDKAMRELGFKRTGGVELYDNNSSMIQKILSYSALALENYEEDE